MKRSILILDDEIDMAHTIGDMLDFVTGEFEHKIASNVNQAIELIKTNTFDCIITDLNLPGIDGISFIEKIRELGNATPVIVTSGRADGDIRKRIQKVGAFDFLPKPFDIAHVGDMLLASMVDKNSEI